MDRIAALNDILTQNPNDAFARYGLAMEYSKQGDFDRSLAEFSILLKTIPTTLLDTSWPRKPGARRPNRRCQSNAHRRHRLCSPHRKSPRAGSKWKRCLRSWDESDKPITSLAILPIAHSTTAGKI